MRTELRRERAYMKAMIDDWSAEDDLDFGASRKYLGLLFMRFFGVCKLLGVVTYMRCETSRYVWVSVRASLTEGKLGKLYCML